MTEIPGQPATTVTNMIQVLLSNGMTLDLPILVENDAQWHAIMKCVAADDMLFTGELAVMRDKIMVMKRYTNPHLQAQAPPPSLASGNVVPLKPVS